MRLLSAALLAVWLNCWAEPVWLTFALLALALVERFRADKLNAALADALTRPDVRPSCVERAPPPP